MKCTEGMYREYLFVPQMVMFMEFRKHSTIYLNCKTSCFYNMISIIGANINKKIPLHGLQNNIVKRLIYYFMVPINHFNLLVSDLIVNNTNETTL